MVVVVLCCWSSSHSLVFVVSQPSVETAEHCDSYFQLSLELDAMK